MSQEDPQKNALCAQSQALLQGPLKRTRTAALALALVPLAAVAVSTQINEMCPSGGICGTVFYDIDNDGIQDAGEPGIPGVSVTIVYIVDGTPYLFTIATNETGFYDFGTSLPRGRIPDLRSDTARVPHHHRLTRAQTTRRTAMELRMGTATASRR